MALLFLTVPSVATKAQTDETGTSELFSYAPTPQTKAFMRYGNNAVDMNTGTLNVSVPIYTYSDNDFELPISVNYSSQGFHPGQQTGILGLGWFLNCGGTISREIKGVPDDHIAFGNNNNGFLIGASFTEEDVMNIKKENLDTETFNYYAINGCETTSDVYHFNFNGHSGTFHFDSSKQPRVYNTGGNHGTYTITPVVESSELRGFVIKTGDGYEYTFGTENKLQQPNSVERSISGKLSDIAVFTLNNTSLSAHPIVTWNLTKIKAPNGRTVTFEYQSIENNTIADISTQRNNNPFLVTSFAPGFLQKDHFGIDHYRNVSIVQTTYLSKISVPDAAEISFQMSLKDCYDRPSTFNAINSVEDDHFITQNLKKLDFIKVKNNKGETVHCSEFEYKIKDNRLLLTKVHIDGIGDYRMSYHEEYSFPSISTADTDFWGFYNGKGNNYDVVSSTKVDGNYNDYIETEAKNPDWRYSRLGCLKLIVYPTNGFSTFEYEPNRADKILLKRKSGAVGGFEEIEEGGVGLDTNVNEEDRVAYLVDIYPYSTLFYDKNECGGVRLVRTFDYDNYSGYQSRSYIYTGGIVYSFPKHYAAQLYYMQVYNPFLEFPSNSLDKQHICYSTVQEVHADGSYSIIRYNDYHSHPDEYQGQVREKVIDSADGVDANKIYTPSYINNIQRLPNSNHAKRGKVSSIEYYNSHKEMVKRTTYGYEMHDTSYTSSIVMSGQFANSVKRYTGDYRLVSIQEEEFANSGCCISRQTISYDDMGRVVCNMQTLPDESRVHTYTQYINDTILHMFSLPSNVIKVKEHDSVMLLTNAIKYDYRVLDSMCLPEKISTARIPDNMAYPCDIATLDYTIKERVLTYDNIGNPTEVVDEHGVHTAILWGYNGLYPVVIARGMTIEQLMSLVSKNDNLLLKKALTKDQRKKVLDNTITAFVDIYEYTPLVGVVKHYSGDAPCTYYKYDSYGRITGILVDKKQMQEFDYINAVDASSN